MEKIKDIFDHSTDNVKPEVGRLLVAEPMMTDPNFSRAVIAPITVDHTDGVMGIVLGNRSALTLSDILDTTGSAGNIPVYTGGPMGNDHLFVIHTLGQSFEAEARPLGNGLWLSSKPDHALLAAEAEIFPNESFRFFLGYAGWTPGQLEREINEDTWAVTERDVLSGKQLLSTDENAQWRYALSSFGDRYRHWNLYPRIPFSN